MKLEKLKATFQNKYAIRVIAGVLIIAVTGGASPACRVYAAKSEPGCAPAVAQEKAEDPDLQNNAKSGEQEQKEDGGDLALADLIKEETASDARPVGKEETVYIIADPTGKPEQTIVSEWLKNPEGKELLEDASDLTEIENVKGTETFEQTGSVLNWNAKGSDIYYQGKTNKQAPVTEKITYYLDGKEVSADELAGKSGRVTIRFDYTNHEKKGDIYVPFTVASGMLLDDSFTNVTVTNGKVVTNGDKNMVFGVAMPGLKESLRVKDRDFSDDVSIPEYVEVTADVKEFSLDMTMTVVMGGSELMGAKSLDLSELDGKIEDLTDAVEQLKDGSGELSDGLLTLDGKMGEFSDGVTSLQGGIAAYTDGAKTLADGIGTLKGQSATLISGVSDLASSVQTLSQGVKTLDEALNTPMGKKEKAAAFETAQAAAQAAVDAQFADDANPQGYRQIKEQAEMQFAETLTSDASLAAVRQQAADAANAQAGQIAAQAAQAAADELGIDEVHAELLPGDKVSIVEKLLASQKEKEKLAFAGDGINDAPVLTRADIGIAMGSMGSDAAIEAADVVLMDDDVRKIAAVVKISRKTLRIVKQNIVFALAVKALVLVLGAFGMANMWEAVFADVGVSVIAILNAMRALKE